MKTMILIKGTAYTLKLPVSKMIACEAAIAPLTLAKVFTPIKGLSKKGMDVSNMELPTIEVMVKILYCSLLEDYPDMTMEKVCSLLDAYFEEAHDVVSAQVVLFMILGQVAGFFKGAENPQALMKRALENIPQKTSKK